MGFFGDFISSYKRKFDNMISKLENRDAIVDCSIRDLKECVEQLQAKLINIKDNTVYINEKVIPELEKREKMWVKKAQASDNEDEALHCLYYHKQILKRIEAIKQQEVSDKESVEKIKDQIAALNLKISNLINKQKDLALRESQTEIIHKHINTGEVERVLNLWEKDISEREGNIVQYDYFGSETIPNSELEDLRAELEKLRNIEK